MCGTVHHCDFIFRDESTQNMDENRRENLAEQLQNVRGFRQMFVISHDDTFTASHANVIKVEKVG
ncbi:MAG TPA: hypothetical protein VFC41_01450 [Anaerovoracaceae bacterium]|nr:hypothetical protein [Anaerovoracaceae bacterium]